MTSAVPPFPVRMNPRQEAFGAFSLAEDGRISADCRFKTASSHRDES